MSPAGPTTLVRGRSTYAGFRATIKAVGTGERGRRDLDFDEARRAMTALLRGQTTTAQAGAFLVAMRLKGESPAELAGFAQALRDATRPLETRGHRPTVACGGSYDGAAGAPELSLAAAALAAGAGAGVVLHCGRTLGPKYGVTPAGVLAALGGPSEPGLAESERMLARSGAALVYTPAAVPGWDRLADVRDEVGVRGPVHAAERLLDPFGARRFVVAYTHRPYASLLLGALERLGAERGVAVRGVGGTVVPRPARPTASDFTGALEVPEGDGLSLGRGESVEESAALVRAVLAGEGEEGAQRAALVSAGAILYAAGSAEDVRSGMVQAAHALAAGHGDRALEAMVG